MISVKVVLASAVLLPILCFASGEQDQASPVSQPANPSAEHNETTYSVIVPGKPLQQIDPKYPDEASSENAQSPVELEATIDKDGSVTNIAIDTGDLTLADAAVDAVRAWKFEPYTKDGRPIRVWQKLIFNFVPNQKSVVLDTHLPPPILATSLFRGQRQDSMSGTSVVYAVGHGIEAPKPIFRPDPAYSRAARKANYQGDCVVSLTIGTDGQAHDIKVVRALGLELDAKAVEAVDKWKFRPGMKNGVPVATYVLIQVNFRLD